MRNPITGVLTAIVTPFDTQGDVNPDALRQQVRRQRSFSREPTFLAHILFAVIPRICG